MSDLPKPNEAHPNKDRPQTKPFSIRLTEEERRVLSDRAGREPLGAFIRDLILGGEVRFRRRAVGNPLQDQEALARVLAHLGRSRLSNNLNQIAKAIHLGVLPVTPETEHEIAGACSDIAAVRRDLMRAMGLAGEDRL